jgi:hypothetical protein
MMDWKGFSGYGGCLFEAIPTTNMLRENTRPLRRDLNRIPPEGQAGVVTIMFGDDIGLM